MTEFERNEFLQHDLDIEEKIDGANLGKSFDFDGNIRVQKRGDRDLGLMNILMSKYGR